MMKFSWYTTPVKVGQCTIYKYAVDRYIPNQVNRSGFGSYIHVKAGTYVTVHDGGWERCKPNLKGGHRHNHWKNAMARMRKCHICGAPIVKGCEVVSQNGWNEFQCRSCWTDENIEQACLVGISFGGIIYKVRKFRRH